jgi:hypothetical protein
MSNTARAFGPFVDVPLDTIGVAGFPCNHCRRLVERIAQIMPGLAPRLVVYTCRCGAVFVWEDEAQPDDISWWHTIKALRRAKCDVVIFNGNKTTTEKFQGVN